jgi:HD-GYP domain-containing protein (c-di-GMP phosphodiesterase class II)
MMDERQGQVRLSKLTLALSLLFLLIQAALFHPIPGSAPSAWGLAAFVALAALAETFPLQVPLGNAVIGVSGIIYWALIIQFPTFWAAAAASIGFLIADLVGRRTSIIKALFNASQVGVSIVLASLTFIAIQGGLGLSLGLQFFGAFAAAIVVYWLINTWLVSIGAWALYGENISSFWARNFRWYWVYELTSAPIALAIAFAYDQLGVIGLLLLALPALMVRLAYSQYLDLKKTYRETVRTLVKVIEMHDPYTAGHSDRVATYVRRLCEEIRLSPATTEKIELAAYLHDLGKINLDLAGIVRKAGKLTEDERRLIKLHPVMSADLANQVSYFKGEIEAIIRHHHENWDGTGYPHGLKGSQIPLGARIILISDAFDAMTTSRVYRGALDLEVVKEEFRKFAGIQFDPDLVTPFLDQVIGDGSGILRQPVDEPLEGQRARVMQKQEHGASVRHIPGQSVVNR